MASKDLNAVYLCIKDGSICDLELSITQLWGLEYNNKNLYFAFESQFSPYQKYVIGNLPRTDLVTQSMESGKCLSALEIKLTAIPDNSTFDLNSSQYGSEIVVRPDTIVYLVCSLCDSMGRDLGNNIPILDLKDWSDPSEVLDNLVIMKDSLSSLSIQNQDKQIPFLLQPVWKTNGKSPILSDYCLDVFTWSNLAFLKFICSICNSDENRVSRQSRTIVWVYKMIVDFLLNGRFDFSEIIDRIALNTRNDKAFAVSGRVTREYMESERLSHLSIHKDEIQNIILGGGQNLLSPERRFDAILVNSPALFKE